MCLAGMPHNVAQAQPVPQMHKLLQKPSAVYRVTLLTSVGCNFGVLRTRMKAGSIHAQFRLVQAAAVMSVAVAT